MFQIRNCIGCVSHRVLAAIIGYFDLINQIFLVLYFWGTSEWLLQIQEEFKAEGETKDKLFNLLVIVSLAIPFIFQFLRVFAAVQLIRSAKKDANPRKALSRAEFWYWIQFAMIVMSMFTLIWDVTCERYNYDIEYYTCSLISLVIQIAAYIVVDGFLVDLQQEILNELPKIIHEKLTK